MLLRRTFMQAGLLVALPAFGDSGMAFPRDFGAHNETGLEWWYLTGILNDAAGAPRYGYQLTFFRLKGPVAAAADHPSAFAARQMLMGHAALSDLSAGRLRHDQRLARTGFSLAEASSADTEVHMRDWSLRRTAEGYQASLRSAPQGFALDLHLKTSQPVLLQGVDGLSRKGPQPGQFSHYYSQVQLLTQARLEVDGKSLTLQGKSWLDHEWSDQLLGAPGADQAVGWDWAGLNLDDGGALQRPVGRWQLAQAGWQHAGFQAGRRDDDAAAPLAQPDEPGRVPGRMDTANTARRRDPQGLDRRAGD